MFWWFGHYRTEQQFRALIARNDRIIGLLEFTLATIKRGHMNVIDRLEKAVEAQSDVHEAIEQLINNFVDEIRGSGGDKAKLESILHSITANTERLADLVLEHTEAEDKEDEDEIPPQVLEPGEHPA
jgi:ABC-type transporter Mla subunit MlaD